MDSEEPVVVVGGGATGVSIARDLALRDVPVTLCERGGLGAGTSGRSHRVLHSGARYAVRDPESAAACARENRILREIAPACLATTGGYLLATPADGTAYLERAVGACREAGVDVERVSPGTVTDTDPAVGELVGAARVPDGVIDSAGLVAATAADAAARGAQIRTHTPVVDITTGGGRVTGVETAAGERLPASHVVCAAGAWTEEVTGLADVPVEMAPTSGAMVVVRTPSAGPERDTDTGTDRGVTSVLNRAQPPDDGDIVVPVGDRVVLGTTSRSVTDPESYPRTDAEVETVLEETAALVPALADRTADATNAYWGVRPLVAAGADGREAARGTTVVDHADRDGLPGLTTVAGGKLTTARLMAERVTDHVLERLGRDRDCRTAATPLDVARGDLPALVARYDAAGPADLAYRSGAERDPAQ